MKRLLCIILIVSLTSTSYAGVIEDFVSKFAEADAKKTEQAEQTSEVTFESRLKELGQKDSIRKFLSIEEDSVGEYLLKLFKGMTKETEQRIKEEFPNLSLDGYKLDTVDNIYKSMAECVKKEVKSAIDREEITNESIKDAALPLAIFGIKVPEIDVSYNMTDEDLDKLCVAFADAIDKLTHPLAVNLFQWLGDNVSDEIKYIFGKE